MLNSKIENIAFDLERLSSLLYALSLQFNDQTDHLKDTANEEAIDYIAETIRAKSRELYALAK